MKKLFFLAFTPLCLLASCDSQPTATAPAPIASPVASVVATPSAAPAQNKIHYLALHPMAADGSVDHSAVPIGSKPAMMQLIAAAQKHDRDAFNQIAQSGNITLMPGGSGVKVVGVDGNFVLVSPLARDVNDKDVTGQQFWAAKVSVQEKTF